MKSIEDEIAFYECIPDGSSWNGITFHGAKCLIWPYRHWIHWALVLKCYFLCCHGDRLNTCSNSFSNVLVIQQTPTDGWKYRYQIPKIHNFHFQEAFKRAVIVWRYIDPCIWHHVCNMQVCYWSLAKHGKVVGCIPKVHIFWSDVIIIEGIRILFYGLNLLHIFSKMLYDMSQHGS